MLKLPLDLSRRRVDRLEKSAIGLGLFRWKICAAIVSMANLVRLRRSAENIALIAGRYVKEQASGSNAGAMKFVVPNAPGHTVWPSRVGEASFFAIGRPSASFVSLHVILP